MEENVRQPSTSSRVRTVFSAALAAILVCLLAAGAEAKYASFVMDSMSGRVLHDINSDTRNYPASLTKVMTLYLLFEAVESGHLTMDTQLTTSAKAVRQPSSKLGLKRGDKISVRRAILALAVKSANDVAVVVAEALGKTERKFALKMTAKARRIGMNRTTFRNASGLPHRGQLSTARDMAILAKAMIRDFPDYYPYFSIKAFTYRGKTYRSHNTLLKTYDGADGLKTGYIRASGYNLVTSAARRGQRVIGVVFGGKSARARDRHMAKLLDKGFRKLDTKPPAAMAKAAPSPASKRRQSKPAPGDWGVQVGAYYQFAPAYEVARKAVSRLPTLLGDGSIKVVTRAQKRKTLYRARIIHITRKQAYRACRLLKKSKVPCFAVRIPKKALRVASAG